MGLSLETAVNFCILLGGIGGLVAVVAGFFEGRPAKISVVAGGAIAVLSSLGAYYVGKEAEASRNAMYRERVLLAVDLACHRWKGDYVQLLGGFAALKRIKKKDGGQTIWGVLYGLPKHSYSAQTWAHYRPLFQSTASEVRREIQEIMGAHGDVIPPDFKARIISKLDQIGLEQNLNLNLEHYLSMMTVNDIDGWFDMRFKTVTKMVADISQEADRHREQSTPRI